jgi:hypothetical protein
MGDLLLPSSVLLTSRQSLRAHCEEWDRKSAISHDALAFLVVIPEGDLLSLNRCHHVMIQRQASSAMMEESPGGTQQA